MHPWKLRSRGCFFSLEEVLVQSVLEDLAVRALLQSFVSLVEEEEEVGAPEEGVLSM